MFNIKYINNKLFITSLLLKMKCPNDIGDIF